KEKEIAHIDKILYHWRAHALSTADNPQSKMYAYEAGLHVLEDYLKRNDYSGNVSHTKHLGYYRIDYHQNASQEYVLYVDEKLKPITANYEEIMKSYLERENIGAVGGKIYGKNGKIISAGYYKNKDGKIESYHYGLNRHYSGYMHGASVQRDVEAVSRNAILVRKEFADALSMDSYKLCEMIRKSGYLVVFDPNIEFILK
ncbi:MAG: hypothetical protein PHY47_01880, partial [Lachnospiraceae bacterium]|nr:hypothetical protein [Lachnospiraceae bacterium]